jgi:hypothetical protein
LETLAEDEVSTNEESEEVVELVGLTIDEIKDETELEFATDEIGVELVDEETFGVALKTTLRGLLQGTVKST